MATRQNRATTTKLYPHFLLWLPKSPPGVLESYFNTLETLAISGTIKKFGAYIVCLSLT